MLEIQHSSPIPIYEQLVAGLREMILRGELKEGTPLPPIRKLAKQLDVAINTVARAYMELERRHLIVSNGRKGTFIKEQTKVRQEDHSRIFKKSIVELLQQGMSKEEIEGIFQSNLNQIFH